MNSLSRNIRLCELSFSDVPQSVCYILHSSSQDHTLNNMHLLRLEKEKNRLKKKRKKKIIT